jgi:3,4-dihydroxy 2-butanone 4-phosphate synthase/GTP cyclohydrolase II
MQLTSPETFLCEIKAKLEQAAEYRLRKGRPFCTLTYAQSVDGCIASNPMKPMSLSCEESMVLTHHLRAWHDSILVGIRTVLADNPSLTVRLVSGKNPRTFVLDTKLRTPMHSKLLNHNKGRTWIAAGHGAAATRQDRLRKRGAQVVRFPTNNKGWVQLEPLLDMVGQMGINSLMVEGGARVLTSFMEARLVDQIIVTIAPRIVGGIHAFNRLGSDPSLLPTLGKIRYANFGQDLVVWGEPCWEEQ